MYPITAMPPINITIQPKNSNHTFSLAGLSIVKTPATAIKINSIIVATDGLPGIVLIIAPFDSLTNKSSKPKRKPKQVAEKCVTIKSRMTIVTMERITDAALELFCCDLAMKYSVIPLKIKDRAVVTFIVTQTGKILLKKPMLKIHPAITIAPAMDTKIANPSEIL